MGFQAKTFLYRIAFPYKNSRGKRFQWILAAAIEWESGKEIVKNGIFSWMLVYNCYEVPTLGQMLKSKISSQGFSFVDSQISLYVYLLLLLLRWIFTCVEIDLFLGGLRLRLPFAILLYRFGDCFFYCRKHLLKLKQNL